MFFYTFMPKLLNMSLTAGVAIVFVMLLRLLLKKAPKVFSYALWAVVLFRLLCPVSVDSNVSLYKIFDAPTEGSGEITSVIEYVPNDIVHTEYPSVTLPVPGVSEIINESLPQGKEQLVADPLEAPMSFVTYIWMAGVLAMAIYSIVSYSKLRHKLTIAVPLRDNIFIADDIKSPFVIGLIRPRVYLPCNLRDKEQEYIILHEQHHIRRFDHIVKAFAFLALAIHWFNPLVWVAFILVSKDMEMSCDEAVIRKIGGDVRAEYSASLLTLATGQRIIAGTPLAFGEGDTKGRINNLSKWKKPAVWVVLIAVIACAALTIGLLTNPAPKREFPINSNNVSELNTEQVVENIAKAEKLEDESLLCANADNFDLMFTSDFNWANDGAIRFFYVKNQKTYSAQLRMFHDENKYFITESSDWIEQEENIKLFDYLDALKYMPQDEIRKLSPDADGYSVYMRGSGEPGDYERVLNYGRNGIENSSSWHIHLEVQPLHKVESGGYNGSGDELIHLFYNGDGRYAVGDTSDQSILTGELIPGTTYVSYQCIYMNPLSSYGASSDSGYRYIMGDDHFTMINRGSGDVSAITSSLDTAVEGLGEYPQSSISIRDWKWQAFPYTDEEWNELHKPGTTSFGIYNPNQMFDEILYQPIMDNLFLLRVDGTLWIVELKDNPQMGTYLWSIYSLIPEYAMGVAQWEYAPMLSSRLPVFRFEFDMEYTEISAACENGLLTDWDAQGSPQYEHSMTFHAPDALYWAPITENRTVVGESAIHFTAQRSDGTQTNGTIYLTSSGRSDGRRVYTASLVGAGMYLSPNTEREGAIISESIAAQRDIPAKTETIFKLNLAGNTSMQQAMEITEEMPYWGLNVVNTGTHSITIEIDGTVYEVEAGQTAYIHADKPWEAGSYPISFASVHGMEGSVVCETAPELLKGDKTVLVLHDLTTGNLEISSDGAEDYVFYTNSEQICITVRSETEFKGEITLIDVSQDNAEILFAEVSSKRDKAEFTGLTSARRYRIKCTGLGKCTLIVSG